MLAVLRPTYTFSITVKRPDATYQNVVIGVGPGGSTTPAYPVATYPVPWDKIQGIGADELLKIVRDALANAGLGNAEIRLTRYEETA